MKVIDKLRQKLDADFSQVNQLINTSLHSKISLVNDIGGYITNSGGKRLRPLLVLLIARACNYEGQQQHTLAAIVEFIHTATLLHDDVVDDSTLRRGQDTANSIWGNEAAVLVGDFLYSRSFELMVEVGNMDILQIIANATNVIAEGEVLQLMHQNNPQIKESDYLEVVNYKTAKLFEAATQTAAVLSNSTPEIIAACKTYGNNLGIAYQLIDDVLDYTAKDDKLGKNIGDDLAQGKTTLPLIYLLQHGSKLDKHMVEQAVVNHKIDSLEKIKEAISKSGAIGYCLQLAKHYANLAKDALEILEESEYKSLALELVDFTITRDY